MCSDEGLRTLENFLAFLQGEGKPDQHAFVPEPFNLPFSVSSTEISLFSTIDESGKIERRRLRHVLQSIRK